MMNFTAHVPEYNVSTFHIRANMSIPFFGNDSNELDPEELEKMLFRFDKEPVTISLTAMYILSFVIGIIGNIMSIKVLTRKRTGRTSSLSATRSLLINLAICDLMVVCICMPITVGNLIYKAWVYGDFLCRAVPFIQAVSVSASVLSLTVISVNRYYNVHNPLNARSFFTQKKIHGTIAVVWVVSSSICLPLIFMNKKEDIEIYPGPPPLVFPICREIWPHVMFKQAYNFLLFCALYCLPVLFNMVICFFTVRKLWGSSGNFKGCDFRNQSLPASRLKVRKKIAKMVVALVSLFAISWLPVYMMDIWIDFNIPKPSQDDTPSTWLLQLRPFAQWLGLTNSSLNPICYCFVGDLYRSAKQMKNIYHTRMVSLFSFSFSDGSPPSIPKLLSYRNSLHSTKKSKMNCPLSMGENCDKCYPMISACETPALTSQPLSS